MAQLANFVAMVAGDGTQFEDLEERYQLQVIGHAVRNENIAALEELLQWFVNCNSAATGVQHIFSFAPLWESTIILDWLRTKYPDVEQWTGNGVWNALMPGNRCGEWLNNHTSVQELARNNIEFFDLDEYCCFHELQYLERAAFDEAIFLLAFRRKNYETAAEVAANNPQLARKLCLANNGCILQHHHIEKKIKQVLRQAGLTQSDCASIGLSWPLV